MSSASRPPSRSWYALRRTLPPWSLEANLRELVDMLPRYRVDELIVKVDSEEFSHGQVPLDWARSYQPMLHAVRAEMEKLGIVYSLNPWITLGHCDRERDGRNAIPDLLPLVGHDGVTSTACACPLCPAWREHTVELWELYAETRPRTLWVEDDIRTFNHLPVRFGCFCDAHLARFSAKAGETVARPDLVTALLQPGDPHPWRAAFLDLQAGIIEETATLLARTVRRISPDTHLGLMSSGPRQHALEGRDWHRLAGILAEGRTFYSRPPLGNYWEESLRGLYYTPDSIKLTRHVLPPDTVEQTEVENIPFTRYSKSTAFTFVQLALSFAFGCDGVTLNLFDHTGTPMENDPTFGRMLAAKKPFLDALAAHSVGPGAYRGVQLLFDANGSRHKQLRRGADYGELALEGEVAMTLLEAHGIPTTYSPESVAVAMGQQLRGFSDPQILALLGRGRGLLLDAVAAHTLFERGFGDMIGLRAITAAQTVDKLPSAPLVAEELQHPEFGGAENRYLTLTLPDLMKRPALSVLEPYASAQVISHLVDPARRRRHAGMIAFENALGGRVAIHALDWAASYGIAFHHPSRANQLQVVVRWLATDNAPLLVRGDGVYPLSFRKDGATETLLGLFNLSLDPWEHAEFEITGPMRTPTLLVLTPDGRWIACPQTTVTSPRPGTWLIRSRRTIAFDSPCFVRVSWSEPTPPLTPQK